MEKTLSRQTVAFLSNSIRKPRKLSMWDAHKKSKTFTTKLAWYLNWIELHFPEKKTNGKGKNTKNIHPILIFL